MITYDQYAGKVKKVASDGSTASYYELPEGATELQDLISAKGMNAQIGEVFRACYRYGQVAHSPEIRDIKKILFYANAELKRLQKYKNDIAPMSQSHIDDVLDLPTRARNALVAHGINTIEQLVSQTEKCLIRFVPNLSVKGAADVRKALIKAGLNLKE
jgi:hypothetical protein